LWVAPRYEIDGVALHRRGRGVKRALNAAPPARLI
jgi:hypothetical protein